MSSIEDFMLPCINKQLLGIECPGCGIQRSILFVSKGDFTEAFFMYPAIYTLILFFGFLIFNKYFKLKHANQIKAGLVIINVSIIMISYIYKLNHSIH